MKIANGIEMLEVSVNIMGRQDTIYPTLFIDNDTVILVDTGFPNQLSQFREAFKNANVSFDNLRKIIITHHDIDHIGSLSDIIKASPAPIQALTHEIEKEYIQGEKRPVKLAGLESNLDKLNEQMKSFYGAIKAFFDNFNVTINGTLDDGEELPYCGGIEVIFTPGHTPGHICLYHKQSKTLISGDCLGIKNGALIATASSINYNQDLYINSLKKLAQYDIEAVICYHGGLYKGNVSMRIKEIINEETNL